MLDDAALAAAHSFLVRSLNDSSRGTEDPANPATVQAMQIALHMEKTSPPERSDVLVAAAQAVVLVCLDPRAGYRGAWHDALEQWYGHRIRKVARRARGAGWDHVQQLPGCTATYGSAQARAFIPSSVGDVPHAIAKLQIKGTELESRRVDAPTVPELIAARVPVIAVDESLGMTVGKAAAQVGHAAMLLAAAMDQAWVSRWVRESVPVVVHEVPGEIFRGLAQNPHSVPVHDSGFTEVAPGSVTVLAHPAGY